MHILIGAGLWLFIAITAILNGLLREKLLVPAFGAKIALPLSGVSLSIFACLIIYHGTDYLLLGSTAAYLALGMVWVVITLAFEFAMGVWVERKSVRTIANVFNVFEGNLFTLVLLTTLLTPYVSAELKGLP